MKRKREPECTQSKKTKANVWCDLVLSQIVEYLDEIKDKITFGQVCHEWKALLSTIPFKECVCVSETLDYKLLGNIIGKYFKYDGSECNIEPGDPFTKEGRMGLYNTQKCLTYLPVQSFYVVPERTEIWSVYDELCPTLNLRRINPKIKKLNLGCIIISNEFYKALSKSNVESISLFNCVCFNDFSKTSLKLKYYSVTNSTIEERGGVFDQLNQIPAKKLEALDIDVVDWPKISVKCNANTISYFNRAEYESDESLLRTCLKSTKASTTTTPCVLCKGFGTFKNIESLQNLILLDPHISTFGSMGLKSLEHIKTIKLQKYDGELFEYYVTSEHTKTDAPKYNLFEEIYNHLPPNIEVIHINDKSNEYMNYSTNFKNIKQSIRVYYNDELINK